ncbi:MAG TPA: hypothetical protein DD640_02510 [Clostridiales bacterium]|nr:hypothetical protein [Clostridiales bacterium]
MPRPAVVLCALNARYSHTSLALRYLRTFVGQRWPQAPQLLLTEWTINDQPANIARQLFRMDAAVYAFSCYIWNISQIRQICRQLRKIRPDAWIIWGGPEVSHDADERLSGDSPVDLILSGEGEMTFLELLRRLYPEQETMMVRDAAEARLDSVPGLTWRDPVTGRVRSNPAAPLLKPDAWTFPYTDDDLLASGSRIIYYETSRGCPFRCAYCLSALDKEVRFRPLPQVFAELDRLIAGRLQQVKLVDRTFNCQPERARQIWQYLIDRRETIGGTNFHFEVAGDLLDNESVDLLNQAPPGLIQLEIGVQTINPEVLRIVNRPSRLERLQEQVRKLRRAGRVHLHLDLIAGLPGEDLDSFGHSLDFVWELRPQQLQLGFLKILPGSPMKQLASERGFLWQDDPPYEVLQSDRLNFAGLDLLKTIAQVIDTFHNSGLFGYSLLWLARRWPRPWLFLQELAGWLEGQGCLDRALGSEERSRLLWQFGGKVLPELAAGSRSALAWRDMLRLDYLLSGQKDQPAWMGFWENSPDAADKTRLRQERQLFRERHPDCGRFRIERLSFDRNRLRDCGELYPGLWLAAFDLSGFKPDLLEIWPEHGEGTVRCERSYERFGTS